MKRGALSAAALVSLAIVLGLLWRPKIPPTDPASVDTPSSDQRPLVEVDARAEDTERPTRVAVDTDDPALALLSGRTVDEDGSPLARLRVTLVPFRDPWSEDLAVGTVETEGTQRQGFETWTDREGRFSFSVPVPTADLVVLNVDPDEFHAPCSRGFGMQHLPLEAGSKDLGSLVLASAGGIEGEVRRGDDEPLGGARVDCEGRSTVSDDRGRYRFESILPGSARVGVHTEGFLWTDREVSVRAREWTQGIDFKLRESPTISGRVVDEQGLPLAGVRIRAMSLESRGDVPDLTLVTSGSTDVRGEFTLKLRDRVSQMVFFRTPSFEPETLSKVAPGTTELRVEMLRGPDVTIRVVDSLTGEAVERYGVFVAPEWPWPESDAHEIAMQDRPGGTTTLTLPRNAPAFHVVAEGYARSSIDTTGERSDSYVVPMARGARVVGRVLRGDEPMPQVRVGLMNASPEMWKNFTNGLRPDSRPYEYRLADLEGSFLDARTNADGRFEFAGLTEGTYELSIRDARFSPVERYPVSVPAAETVDVGDLMLELGATLRGKILRTTEGPSRSWTVSLDPSGSLCLAEADYRYELFGLPPGPQEVFLHGPGMSQPVRMASIELAAGETRELDLDAGLQEPALVSALVTCDGRPLVGFRVSVTCKDPELDQRWQMSSTDANGFAGLAVPPCEHAKWEVRAPSGLKMRMAEGIEKITPGARVELELRVEAGELALQFPDGLGFPEGGSIDVRLRPMDRESQARSSIAVVPPDMPHSENSVRWTDGEVELGLVPPGEYVVLASIRYATPAAEDSDPEPVKKRTTLRGRVEVESGSRSTCRMQEQSNSDRQNGK